MPRIAKPLTNAAFTSKLMDGALTPEINRAIVQAFVLDALLTSSPRLKPGDSLNWGLMSQTESENVLRCVDISVVFRSAGRTYPVPYRQAT